MRTWDSYHAYLFDLDGTLLHCVDAVHYFGFCRALELLAGRPLTLDGVTAHGNTDLGIIRDAMALAAVPQQQWKPRLAAALTTMQRYVSDHEAEMDVAPIPGAARMLAMLRHKGVAIGVATGNLESIGRAKLRRAGYDEAMNYGSFSDGLESREDVFERAATNLPHGILRTDICFVGDTPRDIQAAQSCDAAVIAVATGTYSIDQLQQEEPTICVADLSELFL